MSEDQQQWRAQHYALLATLLAAPPQTALLENIAEVDVTEPESPMGQVWLTLQHAAKQADKEDLSAECKVLLVSLP